MKTFFSSLKMKTVLKGRRSQDTKYINKHVIADLHAVALDAFDDFFVHLLLRCKNCVVDEGDYTGMCICSCRLSPRTILFDLIYIIHAGTKHEIMFSTISNLLPKPQHLWMESGHHQGCSFTYTKLTKVLHVILQFQNVSSYWLMLVWHLTVKSLLK